MIFCGFNECLIYTPDGFIEDSLKLGEIIIQSLIYFCMPMLFSRLIPPKVLETAHRRNSVVLAAAIRVILDYLRAGVS